MITFTLVAILGVLLVAVLMQLSKKPAAPRASEWPPPDLGNLKVTDARPGDAISISGAGDEMTDLDFTADRLTRVEAGARRWFEIGGPYRERRVALRVSGDENIEVALQSPRKVTLEDLGLSEDDLAQMDERQNTADNFEFEGIWQYRLSREARAIRDGSEAVGFYYWEFHDEVGKRLLELRKAEGEPFTAAMYSYIPAADVTIYRARG